MRQIERLGADFLCPASVETEAFYGKCVETHWHDKCHNPFSTGFL